jgi:hypothetical protein
MYDVLLQVVKVVFPRGDAGTSNSISHHVPCELRVRSKLSFIFIMFNVIFFKRENLLLVSCDRVILLTIVWQNFLSVLC